MNKQQRLVLVISILASFMSFLDGFIVNVALPAINSDLGGGLAAQQWVTSAYLITLGALILIAGSLSDLFGRKRILTWGIAGFGVASILCAAAPSIEILIVSRALQGVFGALLVPSSLALIISSFKGPAQSKAIGSWTAWTGIAAVIGPFVGGILVDALSWRWIFIVNVIPIIITLWFMRSLGSDRPSERAKIDMIGAISGTLGLALSVYALIEQPTLGWDNPVIYGTLVMGISLCAGFLMYEKRAENPMLPLTLFTNRNFSAGNLATTSIYAGLSVSTFLLIIFLQQIGGYTALEAGISLIPVTIIMFILSSRFGALSGKYGPRLFMSLGPIISALGFLLFLRVDASVDYLTQVFPAIVIFGFGLSMTVAPLTSAVLGGVNSRHAGIASAINNAVARIAGLIAIAAIGLVTGPVLKLDGFHSAISWMVALLAAGGIISAIGIVNPKPENNN